MKLAKRSSGSWGAEKATSSWTEYVIWADPENLDAMATAVVLGRLLVKGMPERGLTPRVFTVEDNVSMEDLRIVLLLPERCFHSRCSR